MPIFIFRLLLKDEWIFILWTDRAALWAIFFGLYMALLIGQIKIWQETGWAREGEWHAAKGPRQGLKHRAAVVRTKPTELNGALYPFCSCSRVASFLFNPWVVQKNSPNRLLWLKYYYLYWDLYIFFIYTHTVFTDFLSVVCAKFVEVWL